MLGLDWDLGLVNNEKRSFHVEILVVSLPQKGGVWRISLICIYLAPTQTLINNWVMHNNSECGN